MGLLHDSNALPLLLGVTNLYFLKVGFSTVNVVLWAGCSWYSRGELLCILVGHRTWRNSGCMWLKLGFVCQSAC